MRLLVIEDEADLRRVIVQALREEGYAVDASATGEDGLQKALNWEYAAIVLDLRLPGIAGEEFLRQLRQTRETPVVVLSAKNRLADRITNLDEGADDYLVKPFELAELFARLRAVIRRSQGHAHPQIEIGAIRIDTATREVYREGERVHLTAREYALVELLAMHRGQLVTREMIYNELFDEDDDSLSNLVDVHISNIRKKLGREWITTRRGHGYLVDD